MTENSIYWYDFETFGSDPRRARAAQFAGLRTDEQLRPIGEPLVLYCRPAGDFLPEPMACWITGITPQKALAEGVCEAEFIDRIQREFIRPGTCVAGYNNIRFDDELTRQLLYRNFFDPYAHEWRDGNSRWDIIDMARLCAAVRPGGIHWPQDDAGAGMFRLTDLTAANRLAHERAHDALSDVRATVALAALIRQRQPRLYEYAYRLRSKDRVAEHINFNSRKPFLHVSGKYPARLGCLALVMPVGRHPVNGNGVIVYDLRVNPRQWRGLLSEQLAARLYTRRSELHGERLPLKVIAKNRCPVIAPPNVLAPARAADFNIDYEVCRANWEFLRGDGDLLRRFCELFREERGGGSDDPDYMIYSGGFFDDTDRAQMETLHDCAPEVLGRLDLPFKDARLPEMLFRYRARNYPETLSGAESAAWRGFCRGRLEEPTAAAEFERGLAELEAGGEPAAATFAAELRDYAAGIRAAAQAAEDEGPG